MRRFLALVTSVAVLALAPAADAAPDWFVAGDAITGADPALGGPATAALLSRPVALARSAEGGFLVGEADGRVERVDAFGVVSVVVVSGALNNALTDVAELPDGSVLIADGRQSVLRVVDGNVTRVAGGDKAGFAGDGGPASAALLSEPTGLAVFADGSYLIADSKNNRIRRVAPNGTISTVAGDGKPGDAAIPRGPAPAAAANLSGPQGVAALPDGGFAIADTGHQAVRRVDPAGMITTVVGHVDTRKFQAEVTEGSDGTDDFVGNVKRVAAAPDGSIYVLTFFKLIQVVDGHLHVVRDDISDAIATEADGGVLLTESHERGRVAWLPPAASKRLALLIDQSTLALAGRVTVRFKSTLAGSARVVVKRGRKTVYDQTAPAVAGSNDVLLPKALKAGQTHTLTITLTGPEGRIATDRMTLVPRGAFPLSAAKAVASAVAAERSGEDYDEFLGSCARVRAARVDCEIGSHEQDVVSCDHVLALFLPANGRIYYREYRCPLRRKLKPKGQRSSAPVRY